jgi:hypothetical protein
MPIFCQDGDRARWHHTTARHAATGVCRLWLLAHPRFQLHFTPTSASWINLVERWFAELTTRRLRRSAHGSVTELEASIRTWSSEWNADPKPFVWTKTAGEILYTFAAFCRPISVTTPPRPSRRGPGPGQAGCRRPLQPSLPGAPGAWRA